MENFVTVFTPTYNRANTLMRLYDSLLKQSDIRFEWIIVDDGSTDNTESLIKKITEKKNKFEIVYFKKENAGKHTAINKGLDLARGKMFIIVDSDDYITEDAIEKIIKYEKQISKSSDSFAGIGFCKGYSKKNIIGTTFRGEYVDATSLQRKKYNINGDKAEVFYTEILKKNKFPVIEGERFVPEALVWNRIAKQGYKIRWFQDIIYIAEYLNDGLTSKGKSIYERSPKALLMYLNETIENEKLGFFRKTLKYEYYSNAIYNNKNLEKASEDLKINKTSLMIGIFLRRIVNRVRKCKKMLRKS